MADQVDPSVRQAGAVYLKNTVSNYWDEPDAEDKPTDPPKFTINANDKQTFRDNLVEAVISAPTPIRAQLSVCVCHIVKEDYPIRWPGIAEKILTFLQSDRHETWIGSIICLYQLVKNYEYKSKTDERKYLNEAMVHILPLVHKICIQLLPDASQPSVTVQKEILKVFMALIQFHLPLDLVTKEIFTAWMELCCQIIDRPVPEECEQVDVDDRPELIWWKCKKWALHIITRSFERYGSPGNVMKEYNGFSEWYLKSFTGGIIQVLLKVLNQYRTKIYITPRILQLTISYLTQGVSHAFAWKIIKPHMQTVVQDVIFPLMCHSDEDEELWQSDPVEYIRIKYDVYEDFFNPSTAAQCLLHAAVAKRKEFLQKTMGFIVSVLTTPSLDPRRKSGALQMIGSLADILLVKKIYKDQAERMLVTHVLPEFANPHGYMRARACWVLHSFSEIKFKNDANLKMAIDLLRAILNTDTELPVRIEAAIGLQKMIEQQEAAGELVLPHIQQVILDLLNLIRETENDDLTSVLQKIICAFQEQITPLAVEIVTHLAHTFAMVIESEEQSDDKAITAMGILNTLETICSVMDEQKEIMLHIEGVIVEVITVILKRDVHDFFEEMLSLVFSLTSPHVSERMWSILPLLYELFRKDNMDYFTDMMPALHNYVTVDPVAFLQDPKRMEIIFEMCKASQENSCIMHTVRIFGFRKVLHGDAGEDAECHAAKLLEVILVQYRGVIDLVVPLFVELVFERLMREIQTSELRVMCLQVVIAALYYNPTLLLSILEKAHVPTAANESLTAHFLKLWLADTDCFLGLHDRKMCILGMCTLMSLPSSRPQAINEIAPQILPSLVLIFKGLKRAYETRDKEEDSDDDEEAEEDEDGEVEDEDDVIDADADNYLAKLEKSAELDDDDDEYEGEEDDADETSLESYETPLDKEDSPVDEYAIFKVLLESLRQTDPAWYDLLVRQLTEEQRKDIDEIFRLADQRRAAAESKKILQAGGYNFTQVQVPATFNFGSPQ